jgi:hypothetical protein
MALTIGRASADDTARRLLQIDDEIMMDGQCRVTVIDAGFKIAEVYGGEADVIMMPSTAGVFYGRYYNSYKAKLKNYGPVHRELFKDAEGLMCWRNARFKLCIFSLR